MNERTLLTRAEAMATIKAAPTGSLFYLHIRNDAPIIGQPDRVYQSGLSSYVKLSRGDAVRLCKEILTDSLEEKGARIPFSIRPEDRQKWDVKARMFVVKPATLYWLG